MQPLHAKSPRSRPVLPMGSLLVALALALGLSYWLVPEQNELVERLIKDHQYTRLQKTLSSFGSTIDPSDLRYLSRAELTALATLARLTPRERLNVIFSNSPAHYNRFLHAMVLTDVRYVDVIKPADAWTIVKNHHVGLSGTQLIEIATVLAHNALAIGTPAVAVEIFSFACDLPESNSQLAQELAIACRWTGKPLDGALKLRAWLATHTESVSPENRQSLNDLGAQLAIEGNAASVAFDFTVDELRLLPNAQPAPLPLLERAQSFATQSNRTRDLLPWIRSYAASLPEAKLSLKDLHLQQQRSPETGKNYARWLTTLAQAADWNSDFDASFDQHLRLAVMKHLDSLDRCVALSDFLGRDEETVEALLLLGEIKERPQLRLSLAEMLASLGRDEEAQPLYEAWLKAHPEDRAVAYALACLLEDEGDEDKAMAAFERLLKTHPGDVPALKKLAENYIRADRHHEALELYQSLHDQDHDHYTRENFAMLAESLDDHATLLTAQLLIARAENTSEAWLDIAETAAYLKDKRPALTAMQEGLQHQPRSHGLRLAIAQLHTEALHFEDAVAVLMHDSVKESQPAIEALLHLVDEIQDHAALLKFVGTDLEKRMPLSTTARLDLAMLCHFGNDEQRSEALFRSVPATKETHIAIAEARYATGHFDSAEKQMSDFLKDNPSAVPNDWVFLGDIYDAMGREEDANRAYTQSLTLLTADLSAPRTTSSLARPLQPPILSPP